MSTKIRKSVLLYILFFIPFFKPVGLSIYGGINSIYLAWKLVSLCVGIFIILNESNGTFITYKKDTWFRGLFLFFIVYFVNCFSASRNLVTIVSNILVILELIIILSITKSKLKRKNMADALNFVFSILLFLQIVSVFYIKAGHVIFEYLENDYTYLLGTDNYSAFATIPMLGAILFFEHKRKNLFSKAKKVILCLGLCASYVYTGSVTAAIMSVVTVFAYIITKYNKFLLKFFTIKKVAVFCVLVLFLIMAFDIQNHMLWLLRLVGKSAEATTLNSRTIIWENAFNIIKQNIIFGIGELSAEQVEGYALYGMGHAHNLILDLLLKSGIVGTISYLFFYFGFLSKYFRKALKSSGFILVITLTGYFVLSMMDDYPFMPYIYCCLGLLWGSVKNEE